MKQKFLIVAKSFALSKNDDDWFCEIYLNYREFINIHDSVFFTLCYLYGNEIAKEIERGIK